jgi:hypothetical protein
MPVLRSLPICALFIAVFAGASEDPSRVAVKGTHLSLVPQKGFTESENFTGFESQEHEASIMVVEIPVKSGPGALKVFEEGFTPAALSRRGLVLKSKERGTQNGLPWLVLKGELRQDDKPYVQWIFLWESKEPRIGEVMVTAPLESFPAIEDNAKAMFESLRWEARAAEASRYYSVQLPKGWKLAKQVGPLDLYTESGRFPKAKDEAALGVMLLNEGSADFKTFVKESNLKRNYYTDLKELESQFLKIDGLEANFSQVSGIHVKDQSEVILQYCYISLGKARMFIEGERTPKLDQKLFEDTCKTIKIKRRAEP